MEATPDICDGLDNDCNNETDEAGVCGECPWNTVRVGSYCIDRWEAGADPDRPAAATSAPDAIPLTGVGFNAAKQICVNAGKDLCPKSVWIQSCQSATGTAASACARRPSTHE